MSKLLRTRLKYTRASREHHCNEHKALLTVEGRALACLRILDSNPGQPLLTLVLISTSQELRGHKVRIYEFILAL